MNDAMLMKVHNSIDNLSGVITNHTLSKRPKVVEDLIQAASRHPLNEDVDVALVLSGSQAADDIGVRETTQHHDLIVQPLQLLLLLCLGVPDVAHLRMEGREAEGDHSDKTLSVKSANLFDSHHGTKTSVSS